MNTFVERSASRIEARNGDLRALVARGTQSTSGNQNAEADGPQQLVGIPFTAKDTLATYDLPTTCGSRALEGSRTSLDATAVARLRGAGAVLMGKTNCPEFALGVDTTNELFGPTRNPLGPWTAGGSSGGEAAAVSSGMSLVGLGSDFGGSIRWPAQCAGLVGLRPTVGRVPRSGQLPVLPGTDPLCVPDFSLQSTLQVVGPLCRSVDDADLVLRVVSGPDGHDPIVVDQEVLAYTDLTMSGVEVRWGIGIAQWSVDPEVSQAVSVCARHLGRLGARVREGLPDEVHEGLEVYNKLRSADPMTAVAALGLASPELIGGPVKEILAKRCVLDGTARSALWDERDRLIRQLANWLSGERVLILPVALDQPRDLKGSLGSFDLMAPSRAISLFGLPVLSIPIALARSGAPISVQIVAPAFREDVALAVGAVLEQLNVPAEGQSAVWGPATDAD